MAITFVISWSICKSEIYRSLQQRKNFANRSRIDKVIAMVRVAHFFDSLCIPLVWPLTDLEALRRIKLPGKSEVDDFDLVGVGRDAEDVLWFEVEMKNLFAVHVEDCVADLSHKVNALAFRQHVVIADDSLQQLTTTHAVQPHTHIFEGLVACRPLSRIFQKIRLAEPYFRLISGLAEFLRLKIRPNTTNSANKTDKLRQSNSKYNQHNKRVWSSDACTLVLHWKDLRTTQ